MDVLYTKNDNERTELMSGGSTGSSFYFALHKGRLSLGPTRSKQLKIGLLPANLIAR